MEPIKFGGHRLLHKLTSPPQVQQRAAALAKLVYEISLYNFYKTN